MWHSVKAYMASRRSSASSTAIRITIGLSSELVVFACLAPGACSCGGFKFLDLLAHRQGGDEGSAFARFTAGSDDTAMAIRNAAAHCQADAGAFVFTASVEALEHPENFIKILFLEADTVVLHDQFADFVVRSGVRPAGERTLDNLGLDFNYWLRIW